MKKYIRYSVLAGSLVVLTACGGGGGSGGGKDDTKATAISFVPDHLKAEVRPRKIIEIYDDAPDAGSKPLHVLDTNELPKGILPETFYVQMKIGNFQYRVVNAPYAYAFTGLYDFNDKYPRTFGRQRASRGGLYTLFDALPKQGTAVYTGYSVAPDSTGKMRLTADFAAKTVEGVLHDRRTAQGVALADVTLHKGEIGNFLGGNKGDFHGEISSNNEKGHYNGSFFGPNAENVAGSAVLDKPEAPFEVFVGEKQ